MIEKVHLIAKNPTRAKELKLIQSNNSEEEESE
jgi:hypothetical protein